MVNVPYWVGSTPETDYPSLSGEISVDVAVLGAGITGITAATLLKRAGKTVAVVDMKRIARGVTGYTTAKVTSAHGVLYTQLIKKFGEHGARVYAESNQAAIERIATLVAEHQLDCDFERADNYVYSEAEDDVPKLQDEVEAAKRVGLPASLVSETSLPYPVAAAYRLENQAQFHPRRYLLPLAERIPGDGSHVFEWTRALEVDEGDPCRIETDKGTLRARDVIVATHIPFLDRGFFWMKAHPSKSYAVAARIEKGADPRGMYISSSQPTRSIRTSPSRDGDDRVLILGGEGHKPGALRDTREAYRALETFVRERFGERPIDYRWSTHDYLPVDGAPYIGRLTRRSKHVYVATAFAKWGITKGTLAAMILSDSILGVDNPWAEFYDAKRLKPVSAAPKFVTENTRAGARFFGDRLARAGAPSVESLGPGEGALVRVRGRKLAVYRDESGQLHALSPVCQHLYCIVAWNPAEKTWDCPCHGSRYTGEGKVIQGPTVKDMQRRELPAGS